jgi:hypothetical protein
MPYMKLHKGEMVIPAASQNGYLHIAFQSGFPPKKRTRRKRFAMRLAVHFVALFEWLMKD